MTMYRYTLHGDHDTDLCAVGSFIDSVMMILQQVMAILACDSCDSKKNETKMEPKWKHIAESWKFISKRSIFRRFKILTEKDGDKHLICFHFKAKRFTTLP